MWSLSFILMLVVTAIAFGDEPHGQIQPSAPEQRLAFAKLAAESCRHAVNEESGC